MKLNKSDLQQRLADDYVMGLMSQQARRNFEKRMRQNPQLREQVQRSEALWNLLSLSIPERTPPRHVWNNIASQLFYEKPKSISQIRRNLQSTPQIQQTNWIKTWAIAASLATVGLTAYIGITQISLPVNDNTQQFVMDEATNQHLAVLINDDKQAGWLLKYHQGTQRIHVQTLQALRLDHQRTYELWIIADGVEQPQSLGLMPEVGEYELKLTEQQMMLVAKVKKFAVSIEPAGGSPTGLPTSAPVYLGDVNKI
ncbi:Anti-sigma-K factor RskA [uncultured Thiomicrorhabdus sp.]